MVQRKKGGVTPCRLHMEDWDSLQCDSTKEFSCHSPTHSFIYSFNPVVTTVEEASEYMGKMMKIKANYHIKQNFSSVYEVYTKVTIATIL